MLAVGEQFLGWCVTWLGELPTASDRVPWQFYKRNDGTVPIFFSQLDSGGRLPGSLQGERSMQRPS